MRTRVKICGITRGSDAHMVVSAGADAIGVILVSESPRSAVACLGELVPVLRRLPPFVLRVAVVRDLAESAHLPAGAFDAVQYYTDSTAAGFYTPLRRIECLRVGRPDASPSSATVSPDAVAVLLDTFDPDRLGGTGRRLDWDVARETAAALTLPVVLAGGLNPDNVGEAIRQVRPYAVDAAGGLESEAGRKDPDRVAAFVREARSAFDETDANGGPHAHL